MSRRKKYPQNYPFESNYDRQPFVKLCKDMLSSDAWNKLTLRQQGLYVYLKNKFTVYKNTDTNVDNISIPTKEVVKLYGDARTFRTDIDKLINTGFIRCISSGYVNKTVSIYGFSDSWKKYGKDGFYIPEKDLRPLSKKNKKTSSFTD